MIDVLHAAERPSESFETTWRATVKRRIILVLAAVMLWAAAVEAKLVWLQVVKHDMYADKAQRQQQSTIKITGLRGDIVDRHGQILATSADATALFADPSEIAHPLGTATAICRALGDCTAKEEADIADKLAADSEFESLRRWRSVSDAQIDRVRKLQLPGVGFRTEPGRYYPNTQLAAHVLGFVGIDNDGLAGVESAFDQVIGGEPGLLLVQRDGNKHRMETRVERAPTPGATLELTIDRDYQEIAERALEEGIRANKAKGGTVIIMSPWTGAILAMANAPTFNPNSYFLASADERRNRATQDVYEPGSTFKIVTASAAIQEGVLKASDIIDTDPGYIAFPGRKPITEAGHHSYGALTFEDVIVKSSNIGAIKAGLRVGAERLGRYVRRFGFGQALGDDFRGESAGIVWSSTNMTDSTLASMSMGYNVSVTPLQMATAASAVANGGTLYEPHVVNAVIRDGQREVVQPKALREAITPETAATITTFMEGVVQRGTAKAAAMAGYQVAGKTGTAHKLENHRYSKTDYNASFVGFVPSRQPVFTILVLIDTPRAGPYVGGAVAAPIFKRIAEQILPREGVPQTLRPAPALIMTSATPAPSPEVVRVANIAPVALGITPDVRGLSAADALRALTAAGLTVQLRGTGFVAAQAPDPGQPFDPGEVSVLELQRKPDAPAARAPGGRN